MSWLTEPMITNVGVDIDESSAIGVRASGDASLQTVIESLDKLVHLLSQNETQSWALRVTQRKADIIAPVSCTTVCEEELKVSRNENSEVRVLLSVGIVEDSVDNISNVLTELGLAHTVDVVFRLLDLQRAVTIEVGLCRSRIAVFWSEDTGVRDGREVDFIITNLQRHHVDVRR
jgi:hypothetical protein